jgi:hypothetical protein
MMKPQSQPTYFDDLARELEEVPTRTWWTKFLTRISGKIRLR